MYTLKDAIYGMAVVTCKSIQEKGGLDAEDIPAEWPEVPRGKNMPDDCQF